jgi:hydrogenase/urease accessory protein HupE
MRRLSAVALAMSITLALVVGEQRAAGGHTTATGIAEVTARGAELRYRLTLVLAELPAPATRDLTAAGEGDAAAIERIATALREKVRVNVNGAACRPGRARLSESRLGDTRMMLDLEFRCPGAPGRLTIRDDWFDLFGEHYRTLARVDGPSGVREVAFLPDAREVSVDLGRASSTPQSGFFWLGVEHILSGYDHLLFLAALLLGGGGIAALLRIVTGFTVAHSVTLTASVLGLVTVPSRFVEPAIAASIVWVAVENVWRARAHAHRWLVSFLFGLVHGLGFASALTPLTLPARRLALALIGFNVGVEAGQALVIALALPLGLWLSHRTWEPRLVRGLSMAVAVVGAIWFVQRLLFV